MKLITFLYELSDVLGVLTDIDAVRIEPSLDSCKIEYMIEAQLSTYSKIHIYSLEAVTNEAVDGLSQMVGIHPMQVIYGALKSPGMHRSTAVACIKQGSRAPMLEMTDPTGNLYESALYRAEMAKENIKVLPLNKGITYEVMAAPTEAGISLFKHWASEMRKSYNDFWLVPFTNDAGQVVFSYRAGLDHSDFVFANGGNGTITPAWRYRDKQLLQLLKLHRTSKSMTFKFCSKGLLTVELQTTLATYLFHFPGRSA